MRRAPHSPETSNGKVVSAVDWLGNRFAIGDTVMYCISAGRGQMMAIGEVIEIRARVLTRRALREPEPGEEVNWGPWPRPDGSVIPGRISYMEPYEDITVKVKTQKTSGRWDNGERTKPAWVNPMNITALKTVETA